MKSAARTCSTSFAVAVLVAIGSLGGCSGSNSNGGDRPSTPPTEVGTISVFDAKVTFLSWTVDGNTQLGMRETGSAFAKQAIVAPLLAQGLTTQEVYLALAPEGAAAPPELVAAQALEAERLHRSPEVRHVTVDTSTLVEKTLSQCEIGILGGSVPPGHTGVFWQLYTATQTQPYQFFPSSNPSDGTQVCPRETTTDYVIAGSCNGSTGTNYVYFFGYAGTCYGGTLLDNQEMVPNTYYYWYTYNSGGAQYSVSNYYTPQPAGMSLVAGMLEEINQ